VVVEDVALGCDRRGARPDGCEQPVCSGLAPEQHRGDATVAELRRDVTERPGAGRDLRIAIALESRGG
jgi:hypothetical protein